MSHPRVATAKLRKVATQKCVKVTVSVFRAATFRPKHGNYDKCIPNAAKVKRHGLLKVCRALLGRYTKTQMVFFAKLHK